MYHGFDEAFLYCAKKLEVVYADETAQALDRSISGTLFAVLTPSRAPAFVTNRHMLDEEMFRARDPVKLKHFKRKSASVTFQVDTRERWPTKTLKVEVRIPPTEVLTPPTGEDLAVMVNPRLSQNADMHRFLMWNMVSNEDYIAGLNVCDFVAYSGFPPGHDPASARPIMRTGTIASDPRFGHTFSDGVGGPNVIAYEAFSWGGSSGSPVFSFQRGLDGSGGFRSHDYRPPRLVGVNVGHYKNEDESSIRAQHSGLSYFVKASVLHAMLKDL